MEHNNYHPVIITEEHWSNSILNIARYTGCINFNGRQYYIVNKNGITILELSNPKSKYYVGMGKAIPPGDPCDLCREDWVKLYRKLGREKILEVVNLGMSISEVKKKYINNHKEEASK